MPSNEDTNLFMRHDIKVSNENFFIMYTNADCLSNKKTELSILVNSQQFLPSVIVITEVNAKVKNQQLPSEFSLDNRLYSMYHVNVGQDNARGIIIYVLKRLNHSELILPSSFSECLFIRLSLQDNSFFTLGVFYRSPRSDTSNNSMLFEVINHVCRCNDTDFLLLLGDFNIGGINWENCFAEKGSGDGSLQNRLLNCMRKNTLIQHITSPTRFRGTQNPSILDLVFTNHPFIEGIDYLSPLGKSDHITLSIACKFVPLLKPNSNKFVFGKGDYPSFFNYMSDTLNSEGYLPSAVEADTESSWVFLRSKILDGIKEFVPACKEQKAKWNTPLPKDVISLIKEKHKIFKKFQATRDRSLHNEYKRLSNLVRKHTRQYKDILLKDIAVSCKSNPKKFWKYVNTQTKTVKDIGNLKLTSDDGTVQTIDEDLAKADAFSEFFHSVYTIEPDSQLPVLNAVRPASSMGDFEISEIEVSSKLANINCNKSPGPDQIHPRVLYELRNVVSKPLCQIFNTSLTTGVVPTDWCFSSITVIHKKGSKADVSNYRPISLTCIASKIMESIIRDKILDYFNLNCLFSNNQFGFISGRSTVLQLLCLLDNWTKALDNGGQIDIIYTDFEKAFDRVPHKRLIYKLKSYGMSDKLVTWIEAFLCDRKQSVVINGKSSSAKSVLSGIPQGSVLGPLLFVIYVNDLPPTCDYAPLFLFADDSKLYKHVLEASDCDLLLHDTQRVLDWCDQWLMKVNVNKCKKLTLYTGNSVSHDFKYGFNIPCDNGNVYREIDSVSHISDLGVTIDSKLNFSIHIYDKINKAYRFLGLIRRTFSGASKDVLVLLYKSLVRSQLEYANSVFNPHLKGLIEDLEKVQRRATKMIPECSGLCYKDRLVLLKLPTLKYRRARGDMIELFKIVHGLYDPAVCPPLSFSATSTRGHTFKLEHTYARLNIRKYSFFVRTVGIWNALPQVVVNASSLNTFKSQLDKFWSSHAFVYDWEAEVPGSNL